MADKDKETKDPTDGSPKPVATFGQQIIIVILVVSVGLLFGMGPVIGVLQDGGPRELAAGISQSDIFRHQRIGERLQRNLNPEFSQQGEFFVYGQGQEAADRIFQLLLHARMAEQEGVAPSRRDVDAWFDEWQRQTVPETTTTYGQALLRAQGRRDAVSAREVQDFLAVQMSADVYRERHITVPAAPPSLATNLGYMMRHQVLLRSVTLDSEHLITDELIASVAEDEQAVEDMFNELRERHYRTPATRTVHLYVADPEVIAAAMTIPAEEIQAAYEAAVDERFTHRSSDDDGNDVVEIQPLEEVAEKLAEELSRQAAAKLSNTLAGRLRQALIDANLAGSDSLTPADLAPVIAEVQVSAEDDPRLNEAVGFQIIEDVRVRQPSHGETRSALGELGEIDGSELNLFVETHGPGFLSAPYRPLRNGGRSDKQVAILITDSREAGYEDLDTVRDEVVRYLAARGQYQELRQSAEAILEKAREAGSLEAVFADNEELQGRWNVSGPSERTVDSSDVLGPPPQRLGDLGQRAIPVIALGAGRDTRQLALPDSAASGSGAWRERPRIRIVELVDLKENDDPMVAFQSQFQAPQFIRQSIQGQLQQDFMRQLQSVIDGR